MYQFFNPLTEPIGALWSLMVWSVLWLVFRRQWRSAFWLGLPTAVLFVIGSTPLTEMLVAREERQWVADEKSEIRNRRRDGRDERRRRWEYQDEWRAARPAGSGEGEW